MCIRDSCVPAPTPTPKDDTSSVPKASVLRSNRPRRRALAGGPDEGITGVTPPRPPRGARRRGRWVGSPQRPDEGEARASFRATSSRGPRGRAWPRTHPRRNRRPQRG
eukprot:5606351-Alexandrium_andersonii.AAC.1